jgi:hypothetical protein
MHRQTVIPRSKIPRYRRISRQARRSGITSTKSSNMSVEFSRCPMVSFSMVV